MVLERKSYYYKLFFTTTTGMRYMASPGLAKGTLQLTLAGGAPDSRQELTAWMKQGDSTVAVGRLSIDAFQSISRRVVVVPVGDATYDQAAALAEGLNGIYKQAGVRWDATVADQVLPMPEGVGESIKVDKSLFSAYSAGMRRIRSAFCSTSTYQRLGDQDIYYIFLTTLPMGGEDDNSGFDGYMPYGKPFGFVRSAGMGATELAWTIAHELGHGAFQLQHVWKEQGYTTDTRNLMGYSKTGELFRWQWQDIHHPVSHSNLLADEEDLGVTKGTIRIKWVPCRLDYVNKKKELAYNFVYNDYINHATYYKLVDGKGIVSYTNENNTTEVVDKYSVTFNQGKEWYPLCMSNLKDSYSCLSCEINQIIGAWEKEVVKYSKYASRYVLPVEDIFIVINGEDFDGAEANRLAAGGYILLEAIQVGKVYKFVKGSVKVATATGKAATKVMLKQTMKDISKDAAINLAVQFVCKLFVNIANNDPNPATSAMLKVSTKDALIAGMMNNDFYSDSKLQSSLSCLMGLFSKAQEKKSSIFDLNVLAKSGSECLISLGTRFTLKKLKTTNQYKELVDLIKDKRKYDLIMDWMLKKVGKDTYNNLLETFAEEGLKSLTEVKYVR